MKKVNIFVTHFRKWNPYYIDSLHNEIFQAFISWNLNDYVFEFEWLSTDNENPKFSVSENLNIT